MCIRDSIWAVNALARDVTRWTVACDKRLLRLISYMHHSKYKKQVCFVGDHPQNCRIALYVDASFAGEARDSKSTTGGILFLVGPQTCVPITWMCKKQGAVSHSSTEAEVIALDTTMRLEGLPSLMLWEEVIDVFCGPPAKSKAQWVTLSTKGLSPEARVLANVDYVPPSLPRENGRAKLIVLEDNEAVIKITIKGRSPNLRLSLIHI